MHENKHGAIGKIIVLKDSVDFKKLKAMAGKKLGIRVKRVFQANGEEIEGMELVQNNDQLYMSTGAEFFKHNKRGNAMGDEVYSISVLGTGGVGKSALTLRFIRDVFVEEWDPTIEDAYRKTVEVDDKLCTIEILDTAGQDDFLTLRPQWMLEKDAYVFVYSMTSQNTLKELEHFYELHEQMNDNRKVPIILVANKKDLINNSKELVSKDEGKEMAKMWNAKYIESSAFNGENVDNIFKECIREVRKVNAPPEKKKSGFFSFCSVL